MKLPKRRNNTLSAAALTALKVSTHVGESLVARLINASSREQKVPGSNPRGDKSHDD